MLTTPVCIFSHEPTDRVLRIRDRLLGATPAICTDRASSLTRAFAEHEGESAVSRWMHAIDAVLREMRIYIAPDELIVGNQACSCLAAPLFPEAAISWLIEDLPIFETREQDPFRITSEAATVIAEIYPYWVDRCMEAAYLARRPIHIADAEKARVIRIKSSGGIGHHLLNSKLVLEHGLDGVIATIERRLQRGRTEGASTHQVEFWHALQNCCNSMIAYAGRFAMEALRQATTTSDRHRQAELRQIAHTCQRVPRHPAESFHDALQTVWFLTVIGHIFQSGGGVTIGRLDQILQPYLENDLVRGRIDLETAQETLDCFWLKLQDLNVARPSAQVLAWAGYEVNPTVNLGGLTSAGSDATNDMTFMCLLSERHVHMRNPQLILRIHNETPEALWRAAVDVMRRGGGKPSLISDRVSMKALDALGVPQKDLWDYSVIGCAEPTSGDSRIMVRWSWLCLPKVLEITLNNGLDPITGLKVGIETGQPSTFPGFEELMMAFRRQVEHQIALITEAVNEIADPIVAEEMPHLPWSALSSSCIENGLDLTAGGAERTWSVIWPIAPATTANALTAILSVLYIDRSTDWEELLDALSVDFKGYDILRHRLKRAPKFGNDDDMADRIARAVVVMVYEALEKHRNRFGGRFTTGFITLGANVHYGQFVGATADGRLAGQPLSDGMSPSQGTEYEGPTASLKSVAGLDLSRAGSGGILNQRFNPSLLQSETGLSNFIHLNRTYLNDLGGLQVQYNIVSSQVLREAQVDPDNYRDLLIRVVGYCARFIDLSLEVQNDIIARSEHGLRY